MTVDRFQPPAAGAPTPVRFPAIARDTLSNGLSVWTIRHTAAPVATALLLVRAGTADDPADRYGLAAMASDLCGEGADGLGPIALGDKLARLGSRLDIGAGPDITSLGFTSLTKHFDGVLDLLGAIACRPDYDPSSLDRLRELRLSRLSQLRHSATAVAERAFVKAIFPAHGYGHGSLGTTAALQALTVRDVRAWHARAFRPSQAVLLVGGDVVPQDVIRAAHRAFGGWTEPSGVVATPSRGTFAAASAPHIVLVDRPEAPQSVLRIGHLGPARTTTAYHPLVVLNAVLGGQFSSRINIQLRERRAITYGARTSLEVRRDAGAFACETSVQADATASAITDVLNEFRAVREPGSLTADEISRATRSLTRGYVRGFETSSHLVRAAAELAAFHLPDSTFDEFVPAIAHQTEESARTAAVDFVHPDRAVAVVVGDSTVCRPSLDALGWPVEVTTPEF
jgi:predicted Zn-dependent peptidase